MANGRGGWYGLLGGTTKGSGPVGRPSTPWVMSGSFAGICAFIPSFLDGFLGSDSMLKILLDSGFCAVYGVIFTHNEATRGRRPRGV